MFSQGDIRNILVNLDLRKISHFLGGKVPFGYYDAACQVWAQAWSYISVQRLDARGMRVTGHSMGGVNATLSGSIAYSLGLNPEVWTYGAPKPGDAAFCAAIGLSEYQARERAGQECMECWVGNEVVERNGALCRVS